MLSQIQLAWACGLVRTWNSHSELVAGGISPVRVNQLLRAPFAARWHEHTQLAQIAIRFDRALAIAARGTMRKAATWARLKRVPRDLYQSGTMVGARLFPRNPQVFPGIPRFPQVSPVSAR